MNGLLQDLRYSLRSFQKRPGFALLAILILGLGGGATTVIFALISSVLLKPLKYPEPERLVAIHIQTDQHGERWGFSYADFLDVKHEARSFEKVAAWGYSGGTISAPGATEYVDGRRISSDVFSVLGVPLAYGRSFAPEEEHVGAAPVAIISTRLWQSRYGSDPKAVGMPLNYDGKAYTIVGITMPGFQLGGDADVYTPLGQNDEPRMQWRGARFLHSVARLRRDTTLTQAQNELAVLSQRLMKQYSNEDGGLTQVPRLLQSEVVQDVRSTLWLLLGTVGIVLLIACVNVASLLLTRVVARQQEFALRMALGAPASRLLRQCLTESTLLGVCGGLLGLVLASVGTQPFLRFWPDGLPRAEEVHLDWRVLAFAITCSVLTGLLFGLIPAVRANRSAIEQTLRSRSRTIAGSAHRPLSGFVISQTALALVLLSAAGIMGRTLLRLSSGNPGVDIHNVLTARVSISPAVSASPAQGRAAWKELVESTARVPGVESAALTDIVPMREGENVLEYSTSSVLPPPGQMPEALTSTVTPEFLHVMRIPLLHGRFLNENDRLGNQTVIVIDEHLARHAFGTQDAVGKVLWMPALGNEPVLVVGVVGHVRQWGLAGDEVSRIQDQCYYLQARLPDKLIRPFSSFMSIVVRTNVPPMSILESLKQQVRGATGDQTLYELRTMEELASASLAQQRFLLLLIGLFSGLALLLACVGTYSVIAHLTGERVPEFGLRAAVGATPGDILRLVLRKSVTILFAGVAIGIAGSFATARILEKLVPGAHAPLFSTFALVLPVLMSVALLASYIPARRAARVDPVVALRYE